MLKSGQHERTPVTTKHEKSRFSRHPVFNHFWLFSREAISRFDLVDE
jgi:hypothetical protein